MKDRHSSRLNKLTRCFSILAARIYTHQYSHGTLSAYTKPRTCTHARTHPTSCTHQDGTGGSTAETFPQALAAHCWLHSLPAAARAGVSRTGMEFRVSGMGLRKFNPKALSYDLPPPTENLKHNPTDYHSRSFNLAGSIALTLLQRLEAVCRSKHECRILFG